MPKIRLLDFSPETRFIKYTMNNRPFPAVTLGAGSYIASAEYGNVTYRNHVLIGKFCALAHELNFNIGWNHNYRNVTIYPFDAPQFEQLRVYTGENPLPLWKKKALQHRQIIIGNDVWIGAGATLMGGVRIGNGAVIGANSVVAKNIPPYAIAVGNPARVIKYRFEPEIIEKLQQIKWWNWNVEKIRRNVSLMENVEKFVEKHYPQKSEQGGGINSEIQSKLAQGWKVYQFVADFKAEYSLLQRILIGFCLSNFKKSLLVIWLGENSTEEDFQMLAKVVQLFGNDAGTHILTVPPANVKIFSPSILRQATHFITTREIINVEILDYLYDTDIKIVSALDEEIFENEPPVMWAKLYEN